MLTIEEAHAHLARCLPNGCTVCIEVKRRIEIRDGAVVQRPIEDDHVTVCIHNGKFSDAQICESACDASLKDAIDAALDKFNDRQSFAAFKRQQTTSMDRVLATCIE